MTKSIMVKVRMIKDGKKAATEEHQDTFVACTMRPGETIRVRAIKDWPGWHKSIDAVSSYNYHRSWLIFDGED